MHICSLTVLLMLSVAAGAQDAAQSIQMQQQIVQQQIMQQQVDLVNQQLLNQSIDTGLGGYRVGARAPRLWQQAGSEPGTAVVRMEDRSRGASIFYTTDGWTPTAASERYLGPITLRRSATVRAIALVAGGVRSYVSTLPVEVTLQSPAAPLVEPIHVAQLTSGTRLPLIFSALVTSRGLKVGDHLPVSLADDLFIGDKLAAHKGTAIQTVVTHVDNSHVQGLPGVLSFSAQALQLEDGTTIPLLGVETMEGADHTKKANIASVIPLAGLSVHGGDAIVPAGTRFQADVLDPHEHVPNSSNRYKP